MIESTDREIYFEMELNWSSLEINANNSFFFKMEIQTQIGILMISKNAAVCLNELYMWLKLNRVIIFFQSTPSKHVPHPPYSRIRGLAEDTIQIVPMTSHSKALWGSQS